MPNFVCETCGQSFLSLSELKSHGSLHSPSRAPSGPQRAPAARLDCPSCGVKFDSEVLLREHAGRAHLR